MPIFTQNFTLDQGADWSWTSQPYVVAGVVQDLTAAGCRAMLRANPADAAPIVSLTNTPGPSGSVVPNGTLGTITLTLTKSATASLAPSGVYQYDVFVDLPGGTSVRLVYGTIVVAPSITH